MNYFKNKSNKVFGYDDEQVAQGFGKDLIKITEEERKALTYVAPVIDPKLEGEMYTLNDTDYKVSFTKDDAIGLMQIKVFFELGNTKTNIALKNGTLMPIKATEFLDFAKWFAQKRNSFFTDRV